MALILSVILFTAFALNVLIGALTGNPVLGDVSEMLLLFAASVCFVAAILRREANSKNNDSN